LGGLELHWVYGTLKHKEEEEEEERGEK